MSDGPILLGAAPVIPAVVHGFSVQVGVGPYPSDAERSHRRAMYAILRPATDETRRKLKRAGQEFILGTLPLTQEGAARITADPDGLVAEETAKAALRAAMALARHVEEA